MEVAESEKISEIRGKVAKYNILKQLYREKKEDYNRRAAELREVDDQLTQVTKEYQLLCGELDDIKSRVPAQYTALFDGVEPFCDVPLQAEISSENSELNRSLTEMILDAARQAKKLENSRDMMRLMLKDKEKQVETLSRQFDDNKISLKRVQQQAESLSLQVAELKDKLSQQQQQQQLAGSSTQDTRHTTCIVGDGGHLDDVITTMNPAVLKCRIKELEQRIAELMNHNAKWKEVCESLQQEAEAANSKLRQLENSLSATQVERDDALAQVKREQESKRKTEELCKQLSNDVRRLETQVHDLEEQLENLEHQQSLAVLVLPGDLLGTSSSSAAAAGRVSGGVVSELNDEIAALRLQSEEYKETLEEEIKEHAITKAQVKSMNQQWRTVFDELRSKQLQLQEATVNTEKLAGMNIKLEQLLREARVDQSLIQRHLSEISQTKTTTTTTTAAAAAADKSSRTVAESDSSFHRKQQQKVSDVKIPRHGILEEDNAVIYKHYTISDAGQQQQQQRRQGPTNPSSCNVPHGWTCRRCTFVNDNPRCVTSCEMCETARTGTGLVTQASDDVINEVQQTTSCDRKHFSPVKQSMLGHVTAPSRLEEDGIVTSPQSRWLYI